VPSICPEVARVPARWTFSRVLLMIVLSLIVGKTVDWIVPPQGYGIILNLGIFIVFGFPIFYLIHPGHKTTACAKKQLSELDMTHRCRETGADLKIP
jgi:hypothetical protein